MHQIFIKLRKTKINSTKETKRIIHLTHEGLSPERTRTIPCRPERYFSKVKEHESFFSV